MAYICYGRRISEDDTCVRYEFGEDDNDPAAGVLVIPHHDPSLWFVEGRVEKPLAARKVASRATRIHAESGAWPEWASVFN